MVPADSPRPVEPAPARGAIPLMAYAVPVRRSAPPRAGLLLHEGQDRPARHAGGDAREGQGAALEIHASSAPRDAPHAGRAAAYYFDAKRPLREEGHPPPLLDTRGRSGFDRIAVVEEPFRRSSRSRWGTGRPGGRRRERHRRGRRPEDRPRLRAIALKPIAKTLSMSLRIARLAHERGVPCFCADLTSTDPGGLDKVFAAASPRSPACRWASWRRTATRTTGTGGHAPPPPLLRRALDSAEKGVFRLDEDFYARSAGSSSPRRTTSRSSVAREGGAMNPRRTPAVAPPLPAEERSGGGNLAVAARPRAAEPRPPEGEARETSGGAFGKRCRPGLRKDLFPQPVTLASVELLRSGATSWCARDRLTARPPRRGQRRGAAERPPDPRPARAPSSRGRTPARSSPRRRRLPRPVELQVAGAALLVVRASVELASSTS